MPGKYSPLEELLQLPLPSFGHLPLKGEGLCCESFLLRRAIPNTDGTARSREYEDQMLDKVIYRIQKKWRRVQAGCHNKGFVHIRITTE